MEIQGYKDKHEYISDKGVKSVVYLMDCMEGLKQIPDKHFELAIVDPPYGIGANKMTLGNGKHKVNRGTRDWDNKIPSNEYFELLIQVCENQIIWGGNYMTEHLSPTGAWVFWDKGTGENDYADGELAWTSFNKPLRKFFKSWVGNNAKDEYIRFHPTQKPIALYEWLIKNYTKENDKILDTHLGSGSSRIACQKAGLEFVGFELDEYYFNASVKRFKEHTAQQTMF